LFNWVEIQDLYVIHDMQTAEHGGSDGVRDYGLVESAVFRPQNKAAYGQEDLCVLAAAYAYGVALNHGFVDGNKRTAWVAARLFLDDNGVSLEFEETDAVMLMEGVAAGIIPEEDVAQWFRERVKAT
jgi:death-on-curing protein